MEQLEAKLDNFDANERQAALKKLMAKVAAGEIALPEPGSDVNVHCHTFFSYNSYGYSPSKFAWLARKQGLAVAGVVDFDVLDALDEFYEAARLVGLKAVAGMETRVFVPEFAQLEINSPGEPGISYHMGVGFPQAKLGGQAEAFLARLKESVQGRNRGLMDRVNKYLKPVVLDYANDVLPLTPAGNPTERHICLAYARKARAMFDSDSQLAAFWTEKLGVSAESLGLPESRDLLNTIRAKTMKRGGVGYIQPDKGSFPDIAAINRFARENGAIPTHTWLNGLSGGEKEIERLLEVSMSTGSAALNIIPDRNFTPGKGLGDIKLLELYKVVELAEKLHLPLVVGTEMNSPGQKFVDSFATEELKPLVGVFLKGAYIVYAHAMLERYGGRGYLSEWSAKNFDGPAAKNEFFEQVGRRLPAGGEEILTDLPTSAGPADVLKRING